METLPVECFHRGVCAYLTVSDLAHLTVCSTSMAALLSGPEAQEQVWNVLLCQRRWTVDPSEVLEAEDHADAVRWKEQYRRMVRAERDHQTYLDDLQRLDLRGWLERHFIGRLASRWDGWEMRYWSWDPSSGSFSAWTDDRRVHRMARFPLQRQSRVRRVSPEEQVTLTAAATGGANTVQQPRPHVFTITHTSFNVLWACRDERELRLWMDKISVTLHPLKFAGQTYQAPAKYLLQKNKKHQDGY